MAATVFVITPFVARAQDPAQPLVTDRPDQTESTQTVPRNSVQVETGWIMTGNGAVQNHGVLGTLLRFGAGGSAEARVGFGGINHTVAGWEAGEIELGFKQRILEGVRTSPSISFMVHVVWSPATGGAYPNGRFSFAHEINDKVSVGYNLGAEASDGTAGRTAVSALGTLTLGLSLAERVGAYAEVFGNAGVVNGGVNGAAVDGGFTFLVGPRAQVDLSGGVRLAGDFDAWYVSAGFSFRVPR